VPPRLLANVAERERSPAVVGGRVSGGVVEGQRVVQDEVSRLELPGKDPVRRSIALDVWHRLEPGLPDMLLESPCRVYAEWARRERPAPRMRAGEILHDPVLSVERSKGIQIDTICAPRSGQ
jgi:hypothetical protein